MTFKEEKFCILFFFREMWGLEMHWTCTFNWIRKVHTRSSFSICIVLEATPWNDCASTSAPCISTVWYCWPSEAIIMSKLYVLQSDSRTWIWVTAVKFYCLLCGWCPFHILVCYLTHLYSWILHSCHNK